MFLFVQAKQSQFALMGSTRELSDAINPLFSYSGNSHLSDQYVPHPSELELAVLEPATPRPDTMQQLLRVVTETNQAQENERKRRRVWEQEQEDRYAQRQAELERQMSEMRQELSFLRSAFAGRPQLSEAQYYYSTPQPSQQYLPDAALSFYHGPPISPPPPSSSSVSPSLGPLASSSMSIIPSELSHKSTESERSSDSGFDRLAIGRNYYQLSQEVMRRHILYLMQVQADQKIPDNQPEGMAHDASQPLRFVWDKTVKQSVHNMHMKSFVLEDIKQNRQLYMELPDRDFSKNILESAFEQTFTTLRQNYKSQQDLWHSKSRSDQRAQNSRRLARKKTKLSTRAAARFKLSIFKDSTFDGAFQIDCMSSDESDEDMDAAQPKVLYTRGYLWRSNRLLRFFNTLDQENSTVPRRGSAKMDRAIGTPKESIGLPPAGVSGWMISRRWTRTTRNKQPDLDEALKRLVTNSSELPLETLYHLGEESEEDDEQEIDLHQLAMPQQYSSSSLHNALV
ncbi:hypothetical protein D9757_002659 [Collybiopsis confluens]|uniref:Uncharacterized protein n=1 Tax=Collybiopsis confluens TaxID=2823264 RepID=A0A8H5HWD2_9AGAR|nr:hypothetical protein D9757_002659 [Collybiopsis confluens]